MKKSLSVYFQILIVLIGLGTVAAMLWLPPHEGRNARATLYETYFKDPFLAYVYIGSIPYFVGLHQAFKLFGYFGRDEISSLPATRALRNVKFCALVSAGLIVGAEAYIIIALGGKDDIAGPVAMGIFATLISIAVAIAAAVIERHSRKARA